LLAAGLGFLKGKSLMKRQRILGRLSAIALAAGALAAGSNASAQLQITEIMSNPTSADDNAWEWIEVYNPSAAPIDLNGYLISRLGDEEFVTPSIQSGQAANTIVPAGGAAVLYDGQLTGAGDFDDNLFRTAWGLSPSVPLIAVNNFGLGLSNGGGTAVGFWPDVAAYSMDLSNADADPDLEVTSFSSAGFSIDYRTDNMFPSVAQGSTIRWSGNGNYQDGAQWAVTTTGTTSVPATLSGNTNNTADTASPGIFPTGTPPVGIAFTEIMYNPASAEPAWEWVEIFNNTGSTIDFSTGWVFDDNDNAALTAANITSGVVPNGTGAILFNASAGGVTLSDMQAAWDQGQNPNFIPIATWSTDLAQGGDQLALWPSLSAYQTEAVTTSPGRTTANAVGTVTYDNEDVEDETGITGVWPNDNNAGSIRLITFDGDPTVGESWALSTTIDGFSLSANGIAGTITIHPGGDLGTPGAFIIAEPGDDADFDNDNDVDGNDFLIWQRGVGVGTDNAAGDANGSGTVDGSDLAIWRSNFGSTATAAAGAIPEPASLMLLSLGLAAWGITSRRKAK
jgi:hypothetical protein